MQTSNRSLQDYQQTRMKFSSNFTFMLTALGYAAGFGSVWRFPYLVFKNGGGTFLVPYFFLLFTLAIPLFYLEISLGQLKGLGLAHLLELESPKFRGFGYIGIIICCYITSYYGLIMTYAMSFLWNSFTYPLPWQVEGQLYSKEYFYKEMIQMSSSITDINFIVWPLLIAYLVSLILVYICIKEGVETSGKVAIVTASAPYFLLIILLIRGLTLDGASSGLYYLFKPDLVKIFDPMVWVDAANQVIFQMSVGEGVLILYGSYRQRQDNITNFSIAIPLLTAFCGLLAGCVVFTYIGYISVKSGIPITELPLTGPDLAFVLYPAILADMPYPNVWCVLFFACLVLLGIDTQFGLIEGIAGTIEDAYYGDLTIFGHKFTIQSTRLLVCGLNGFIGVFYCTDIGFYLLNFVDTYGTGLGFIITAFFEVWYFCWGDRYNQYLVEIKESNNYVPTFISYSWTKICHYSIILLLAFSFYSQVKSTFQYEFLAGCFGWFISLMPLSLAIYIYYTHQSEQLILQNDVELKLID